MATTYLKYANFTCLFGTFDLLENSELFQQVVLPAFRTTESRQVDDTFYTLANVEIVALNDDVEADGVPVLGIAGFLMKAGNEKIGRQYDRNRGYFEDPDAQIRYQTALFFTLIFNNHRVIYYRPSPKAPTIKTFQTTMRLFLRNSYDSFIRRLKEEADDARQLDPESPRVTLKSLRESYPPPHLDVVEMAGEGTLETYVDRFNVINRARFELLNSNADLNMDGIHAVRDLKDNTTSNKTVLSHENDTSSGLKKDAVVKQADVAAQIGNTKIILTGTDLLGDKLVADNAKFAAKTPLNEEILNTRSGARVAYTVFNDEVERGYLSVEDHSARFADEIRDLRARLRRGQL